MTIEDYNFAIIAMPKNGIAAGLLDEKSAKDCVKLVGFEITHRDTPKKLEWLLPFLFQTLISDGIEK